MYSSDGTPSQESNKYALSLVPTSLPLSLLNSGQFLALKPDCRGGLILQKKHYADFVAPGAALGGSFDLNCTSIYAVGQIEIYAPQTLEEKQVAFQRRMACVDRLKDLMLKPSPLHRAYTLVHYFRRWLGTSEEERIPEELLAQLAGVLDSTVAIARQHRPTGAVSQSSAASIATLK